MFSDKFYEIFQNSFFIAHFLANVPVKKQSYDYLNVIVSFSKVQRLTFQQNNMKTHTKKCLQLYEKNRLRHRCFPVNFVKFLRTPFLQNTSGQLKKIDSGTGVFL